jgi:hypothetical protein
MRVDGMCPVAVLSDRDVEERVWTQELAPWCCQSEFGCWPCNRCVSRPVHVLAAIGKLRLQLTLADALDFVESGLQLHFVYLFTFHVRHSHAEIPRVLGFFKNKETRVIRCRSYRKSVNQSESVSNTWQVSIFDTRVSLLNPRRWSFTEPLSQSLDLIS